MRIWPRRRAKRAVFIFIPSGNEKKDPVQALRRKIRFDRGGPPRFAIAPAS